MLLFAGKKALVFGVANKYSIAWGIAQALHAEGAEVGFCYGIPELEKRVRPLAESLNARLIEECNVNDDAALERVFRRAEEAYGALDVVVHSIAYAERRDLDGRFVETSRAGFNTALETSAYSLVALARHAERLMPSGGSILAMTALGSVRVLPHYNVMGVAKAALEASVRYLAHDLGPRGIRVNAISAGVAGFRDTYRLHEQASPLRTLVTPEDVGNTAIWLCSDLARTVTGQVVYVDSGWSIMGAHTRPSEE